MSCPSTSMKSPTSMHFYQFEPFRPVVNMTGSHYLVDNLISQSHWCRGTPDGRQNICCLFDFIFYTKILAKNSVPPQRKHPCSVRFHECMAPFTDKLMLVVVLSGNAAVIWTAAAPETERRHDLSPRSTLGPGCSDRPLGAGLIVRGKYHGRPFLTSLMRQPRERYLSSTLPFALLLPLLCISVPRFHHLLS